ncbi:MAG TPA: hypothetical protein VN222_13180 [Novosphingobium sp.]|nr:hypothetical protein [Novosphingobium sp.]
MSQVGHPLLADQIASAQPHVEPSPREVRAQMVQRLQVGLFGLALMLLLVALASIIMQHARVSDAAGVASAQSSTSASTSGTVDPLADIGVVPSADGAKRSGASRATSSAER